jgi:hypothetical protein
MTWDWFLILIIVAIALLIISWFLALGWWLHLRKKRRMEPSHIQLYFDDNFRNIMGEWDFVTRDRVKMFKKDIGKRLHVVGNDINALDTKKKNLEKRMNGLEKTLLKLEGT